MPTWCPGSVVKAQVEKGKQFIDMLGYAQHRVVVNAGAKMTNVNVYVSIS